MVRVRLDYLHPVIFWSGLVLLLTGIVMVTSASLHVAESTTGNAFFFSEHQAAYLLLGLVVAAGVYFLVSLEWLRQLRFVALAVAFGTLVAVLIPGIGLVVNGSRRWINLGLFTVQASEIVKLCFVIYLAGYIETRKQELRHDWKVFSGPIAVLGLLAVLLLLEPDFGAVVVLGICTLGMLMMAGVPIRYFIMLASGVLLAGALVAVAEPYRVARLMSFLDPWSDQYGSGYQLTQSLIAFGRGHWFGAGLGNGVQKLFYLPEAHTDFVFAVLAEELGLVGVAAVLGVFVCLGYSLFRLGWQLQQHGSSHSAQLVYGIAMIICSQAFINMGVTMGILPTKGLTLPFVSYGGSSLIISLVMLALALRAAAEHAYYRDNLPGKGRVG
jgi:cell division protein FtsW